MLRRSLIIVLVLCAFGAPAIRAQDTWQKEADQLAAMLKWHRGSVVAEVGAGNGKLTVAVAERVGPSGKVYTTEINAKALAHLEELASTHKDITVIRGGEAKTDLPAACFDSIFMRFVYHHLTKPAEIDTSLFQSLRPGGLLAVIDENPRKGTSIPEGVPKNRGGHGVPEKILIHEVTAAGFKVDIVMRKWVARDAYHDVYCVVFRKPVP